MLEIGLKILAEKTNGDYNIVTGKGYSLKIKSTGKHECAIVGPAFFDNNYVRKVEVNKVDQGCRLARDRDGGRRRSRHVFVAISPVIKLELPRSRREGLTGKFTVK